jgi:hypothetical protein
LVELSMIDDVSTVAGYAQASDEATTHQQYKYAVANSFCKDFSYSCARKSSDQMRKAADDLALYVEHAKACRFVIGIGTLLRLILLRLDRICDQSNSIWLTAAACL